MVTFNSLAFIVAGLLLSTACMNGGKQGQSDTSTVDTANTSIKSQGVIGYCWSYAAVAMIESDFKKRTGRDVDLSEEALGFFHFAEQLKAAMDDNLKFNKTDFTLTQGGFINGTRKELGSKDAFALVERWGLIPESQWSVKFEDRIDTAIALDSIKENFLELQAKIQGKQTSVQLNQIFEILTDGAFPSLPPVDGFDNGSGQMNAVQYARNVIGFRPGAFEDVWIDARNAKTELEGTLQRVKKTLADGNVVGISISMPSNSDWRQRIQGSRFLGFGREFALDGAHAMVITDFKNAGGAYGPVPNASEEVAKSIDSSLQFRLKNSWGSTTGINEFGQVIQTGFYDLDMAYVVDVLRSKYYDKDGKFAGYGFIGFTFPRD